MNVTPRPSDCVMNGGMEKVRDQLHEACKVADTERVAHLINAGADINRMVGPLNELNYCLTTAVNTGSLAFVQYLLDNGALPQSSAIKAAAKNGNVPILELLLKPIKAEMAKGGQELPGYRWRTAITGALRAALLEGRAQTAEVMMIFRWRLTKEGGPNDDFGKTIRPGFIAALERDDQVSMAAFLEWGAFGLPDLLQIFATHRRLDLLEEHVRKYNTGKRALTDVLPTVARTGALRTLQFLLGRGANDDNGRALIAAAHNSRAAIVQRLLQVGDYRKVSLSNAICKAAEKGNSQIFLMLLDSGAHPNGALELAARHNHIDIVKILLRSCPHQEEVSNALIAATIVWAQLQKQDNDATRRMECQSVNEKHHHMHVSPVMIILSEAGGNLPGSLYLQLLELFIVCGDEEVVESLLMDYGKYTMMKGIPTERLLAMAIFHRRHKSTSLLIGLPLIDLSDVYEDDNLEVASIKSIYSKRGVNMNGFRVGYHPTPLLAAILAENMELANLLLNPFNVDVNTYCDYQPREGTPTFLPKTPLPTYFEELKYSFGEEPFLHNPLSAAVHLKNIPLIRLLCGHGADPYRAPSVLEKAAQNGILREMIFWDRKDAALHVNQCEQVGGRTILHRAAAYADLGDGENHSDNIGDADLITELIKQGADVNARAQDGQTPLSVAVQAKSLKAVKQLCWAGADLTSTATGFLGTKVGFSGTVHEYAIWLSQGHNDPHNGGEEVVEEGGEDATKRHAIAAFLTQWEKAGIQSMNVDQIKENYERCLREEKKERSASLVQAEDVISELGDDESLYLSEDEDEDENMEKEGNDEAGDESDRIAAQGPAQNMSDDKTDDTDDEKSDEDWELIDEISERA